MSQQERRWPQMRQSGILEGVRALIFSKPEVFRLDGAPFSLQELIEETLAGLPFPRVYEFDCGHTSPMLVMAQGTPLRLNCENGKAKLLQLGTMVC